VEVNVLLYSLACVNMSKNVFQYQEINFYR